MATKVLARGAAYSFELDRGERITFEALILDENAAAVDLTGHTVELIINDTNPGGSEIQKTTNTTHSDAVNGKTQFTITTATTLTANASTGAMWFFGIHWKDDSAPAREDIHSYGTIRVNAVPAGTIA